MISSSKYLFVSILFMKLFPNKVVCCPILVKIFVGTFYLYCANLGMETTGVSKPK